MAKSAGIKSGGVSPLGEVVQAGIVRVPKSADGRTRNWQLFLFFRILSQGEMATANRLLRILDASSEEAMREIVANLENAERYVDRFPQLNPVPAEGGGVAEAPSDPSAPSVEFFRWLARLTGGSDAADKEKFRSWLGGMLAGADAEKQEATGQAEQTGMAGTPGGGSGADGDFFGLLSRMAGISGDANALKLVFERFLSGLHDASLSRFMRGLLTTVRDAAPKLDFDAICRWFGENPGVAGKTALAGRLPLLLGYEILRQFAPPLNGGPDPVWPLVRSEADENRLKRNRDLPVDPVPLQIAFSYSGMQALRIDPLTLASFPDVFKEGMAARSTRLGDLHGSAPENWRETMGLRSVHGYFSTSFLVGDQPVQIDNQLWQRVAEDVAAFNGRSGIHGSLMRSLANLLFRPLGIEVMHLELGQDAYGEAGDGYTSISREHFGFRDGISQPFVDLGLDEPSPGAGAPHRKREWAVVAPGEIFLDRADEDGRYAKEPWNRQLREGATYLVYRKLHQDVGGFRSFLREQRPDGRKAQDRLAAQMMGRWQNGTSLVHAPDQPTPPSDPGDINEFLYLKDDPDGRKCPLGAHVRRVNPRDIGGGNDSRRHRILRRSISYGGSLLPPDSLGDGRERGLLFVAANSRIDLQFEVIQGDWINKGEFLGQAGLEKCPMTGANNGDPADRFTEAGAVAPVSGLPSFVNNRGGDYFFAPGVGTLRLLATGAEKFAPDPGSVAFGAYALGDAKTPELFDPVRLRRYGGEILLGPRRVKHVLLPDRKERIAFVARHEDVVRVLAMEPENDAATPFSIAHYTAAGDRALEGNDLLIGTQIGRKSAKKRLRLQDMLGKAWQLLVKGLPGGTAGAYIQQIVAIASEAGLRRTAHSKRIDLVQDLAAPATYGVISKIFGVPGPDWVSELAIALPFAKQHVGELHPDWLATLKGREISHPGAITLQVWGVLLSSDVVGNVRNQSELKGLARQAGAELREHLRQLLADARQRKPTVPTNLVEAFVVIESQFGNRVDYDRDVIAILLELVSTSMASVPFAFANVMTTMLEGGIKPHLFRPLIKHNPDVLRNIIYESERFQPTIPVFMRRCDVNTQFGLDSSVKAGQWIVCLTQAANLDFRVFPEPGRFDLSRDLSSYLMFGAQGSDRECWGRNRMAMQILQPLVRAVTRLQGLTRIAGPGGDPVRLLVPIVGLKARFSDLLPNY